MAMTDQERGWTGETVHYWPTQATLDNNRPRLFLVQRTELGTPIYVHGRAIGTINSADVVRGDPEEQGFNPYGLAKVELAASPTVGCATVRSFAGSELAERLDSAESDLAVLQGYGVGSRAYGYVSLHPASAFLGLSLTTNTWQTLTGGTLGEAAGINWDDGTGELTVEEAGVYHVAISASIERTAGLTSPRMTTAVWTAEATTAISARHTLAVLQASDAVAATGLLLLDNGAKVRLRVMANANASVDVTDFMIAVIWVAP